eukprot:scaffold89751_cov19-Tisochrysis_lutea.AAC.2
MVLHRVKNTKFQEPHICTQGAPQLHVSMHSSSSTHTHTHTHSQQLAGGLLLVQLPKYTHCLGLGLLGVEVSCRHAAAVGSPPAKSHHLQRGVQDGAQIDRQRL